MAWTAPRTWVTAELVTAALMNTHLRDNLKELWRVIETVPHGEVSNTVNGGYGNVTGVQVASLTSRTYPGYPVEIRWSTAYIYETVTTDGGFAIGLDDAAPGLTTSNIIAWGVGNQQGGGVYSYRFTPSAGVHQYRIHIWQHNGTGADVATAGPGSLTLLERGG